MGDLKLTAAQLEASNRHDVQEVVYLLSGVLPGRGGVPDATFYWATRSITAPLGAAGADVDFDAYLSVPTAIDRSFGFEPGSQASTPAVDILVRNLPFQHSESLVAAFTDDDYALESASATLRVAYVRPGLTVDDLVAADFTPLVLEGFFGAPKDVRLDGFTLPIHPRGAKRSMSLKWPQMPSELAYFDSAQPGAAFNSDPIDVDSLGKFPPLMFGRPEGWFAPMVHSCPMRGLTVSGYDQGATVVQFEALTRGGRRDVELGAGVWYAIHYRWPQYALASGTVDEETNVVTLYLASGLAAEIPRGAYVEEASDTDPWWVLAPHSNYGSSTESWAGGPTPPNPLFGWRLKNGEVKPDQSMLTSDQLNLVFDGTNRAPRSQCKVIGHGEIADSSTSATRWQFLHLQRAGGYPGSGFLPMAYYDPDSLVSVTTQAEYSQLYTGQKNNYPTGGNNGTLTTGSSNASARDGNRNTATVANSSEYFELTFNSAPAPFVDGDTVASVLHIVIGGGSWTIRPAGGSAVNYAVLSGAGEFSIVQTSARQFDQGVRCIAGATGGSITELWWEHALETTQATNRTTDAAVGTGYTVGEVMEPADLIMHFPVAAKEGAIPTGMGLAGCEVSGSITTPTMRYNDATASGQQRYPVLRGLSTDAVFVDFIRPTQVMIGLHALLGREGHTRYINLASYDAAHQRFVDEDIRVNMMLEYEPSWFELERRMGEQFRSVWYYGPSGHECHFMESESQLESNAGDIRQSFRLPGCPASNCFVTGQPFMQRTPVGELINTAAAMYRTDYLTGEQTAHMEKTNADSVSLNGTLRNANGAFDFGWHNAVPNATSGSVPWTVSAQVGSILQLYADRQAYARTRFTFETSWLALGVDRGSLIRVSYPVSFNPPSYRNNVCEVESITVNPQAAERFVVVARSVNKPQKGLDPQFVWTDVYTAAGDQWDTRILQEFDTWADYWSLPNS